MRDRDPGIEEQRMAAAPQIGMERPFGLEHVAELGSVAEEKIAPVGGIVPRQEGDLPDALAAHPRRVFHREVRAAGSRLRVGVDHPRSDAGMARLEPLDEPRGPKIGPGERMVLDERDIGGGGRRDRRHPRRRGGLGVRGDDAKSPEGPDEAGPDGEGGRIGGRDHDLDPVGDALGGEAGQDTVEPRSALLGDEYRAEAQVRHCHLRSAREHRARRRPRDR